MLQYIDKGDIMFTNEDKSSSSNNYQAIKIITTIAVVLQLLIVIVALFVKPILGLAMLALVAVTYILLLNLRNRYFVEIDEYVNRLSNRVKEGEEESLIKMPIGIILYDQEDDNKIEWLNPYMLSQVGDDKLQLGEETDNQISDLVERLEKNQGEEKFNLHFNDKIFQVVREPDYHILYLFDITKQYSIEQQYDHHRPVIGFLLLDNYDEVTRSMDDREVLRFDTMLTTYFSNWFKQRNIYYKKIESDRYLLFTNYKELKEMEKDKFSLIDNIRERTSKRGAPLTISMGLTYSDYESFEDMAEDAESNVDLSLARGGDQAIINRLGEDPEYYGGKSDPMVKRTRVRSRMVTQALEQLMIQSENIIVLGHSNPDLDAIGSALGIRRIAKLNHKEAYVVVDQNDLNKDVRLMVDEVLKNDSLSSAIISPKEAIKHTTENTLIIMVDHHRSSLSICPEAIELSNRVVVIDHHRRGNEFPEDPILVYIEPYASSASELVTEMFEYVTGDGPPITALEATGLLGGIVVDSNNFSLRTGSRTFNAASYLQSVGADNAKIQEILSEDVDVYLKRSKLIMEMEKVAEGIYVTAGPDDQVYNPVVAAQTADTMLSFSDIHASFVITKRPDEKVGISARSTGKINVQLIMEKMGGGGHLSNAATQIEGQTIDQVKAELNSVIHDMIDED